MMPVVSRTIEEVRRAVTTARARGLRIGLVPTMGALHEGHVSLIRAARRETGFVVLSLFVNPAQFGPSEDLARYPRPFERDLEVCRAEGVDLVFAPERRLDNALPGSPTRGCVLSEHDVSSVPVPLDMGRR